MNKMKITVSKLNELADAIIMLHSVRKKYGNLYTDLNVNLYKKLLSITYRTTITQYDAEMLSYLSLGFLDGYIHSGGGAKWWDIAPGILMVEEAGGKVTDLYGNKITNRDLSKGLIASNGHIHDQLLGLISSSSEI